MAKKRNVQKERDDSDVDYAAAADSFASANKQAEEDDSEDSETSSSSEEEDSDVQEENDEPIDDDDDSDNGDEDDDEEDDDVDEQQQFEQPESASGEPCTFDLRNLLAMNAHQINTKKLYSTKKTTQESVTIPAMQVMATLTVDEEHLLEKATDGCAQLVAALWQLPKERSDAGPMIQLPSFDESRIPRALVSQLQPECIKGYFSLVHLPFCYFVFLIEYTAPARTQGRNEVGKVCSRTRYSFEQGEEISKGMG